MSTNALQIFNYDSYPFSVILCIQWWHSWNNSIRDAHKEAFLDMWLQWLGPAAICITYLAFSITRILNHTPISQAGLQVFLPPWFPHIHTTFPIGTLYKIIHQSYLFCAQITHTIKYCLGYLILFILIYTLKNIRSTISLLIFILLLLLFERLEGECDSDA